ncbi:MAG: hypothetical protein JST11_01670 [Acidobacteria bacterium]|nr:hypothetical protein [Acidobacteriota bacterium]
MAAEPIRYRKLPGHRRGIINASSVWLGPDHLLLVKSQRFKEEYKRYYLRDIQAIAVARAGRFHISSRALALGALWFASWVVSLTYLRLTPFVWTAGPLLVIAWLYISFDRSCVCRIYTAVSADVLPSVYRTWTARRFLRAVEPRIREVQGPIDPAWLDVAGRRVGPESAPAPGMLPLTDLPSILEPAAPGPAAATPAGAARTVASDIFLATLLIEAALDAAGFRMNAPALSWLTAAAAVAQIGAAVFLFIDRSRGRLRSAVHKVAIARLIWLTVVYYIGSGLNAITRTAMIPFVPANDVIRAIDLAVSIVLLATGASIVWRAGEEPPPSLLGNGS